jgi:hypothetical protein
MKVNRMRMKTNSMTTKLQVIGLSGKAGSGKDFITEKFFKPLGYHQWSFAWHFKVWLAGKNEASYEEVFHTKPPKVRKLLQEEGTERGRNLYGENIWINTTEQWFKTIQEHWGVNKFIIPDVRFPNEAEAIQRMGGKVFRIVSPIRSSKSNLTPEARQHISEVALDNWSHFDGSILNDPEHAETVSMQVNTLLGESPVITDDPEAPFLVRWLDNLLSY